MLRDIGLTPGDVRSALAAPMADDPSYRTSARCRSSGACAARTAAHERLDRQGYFLRTALPKAPVPFVSDERGKRASA